MNAAMQNRIWENKENMKDKEPVLSALGRIVAAYVANHKVDTNEVGPFIQQIYAVLCNLQSTMALRRTPPQTPINIEDTIQAEHLVCLEDNKKLKMLKRHLRTAYGMTPDEYRARWGLPKDYPMVAPNYAEKRSNLAKSHGLGSGRGRRGGATLTAVPSVAPVSAHEDVNTQTQGAA